MLGFGVLGYFMKLYGYQTGPLILGIILARLIDDNWRRAIISERGDMRRSSRQSGDEPACRDPVPDHRGGAAVEDAAVAEAQGAAKAWGCSMTNRRASWSA